MPSRRTATRRRCDRELELDLDMSFQGDTMPHHRVVVISIDGFAAFYWRDPEARLPTLRRLADRGAVAAGVETVFPSTTWPTHASLMTGVSPSVHGVVANHILNRATRAPEGLTGDPVYDAPDLLLMHFLCVDSLQHLHGPRSPEAYWALEYVDGLIGRVLDGLPDETTVFIVSDHGFLPSTREIRPNVRLRRLGAEREARFVMNHGAGALYALDGDARAIDQLAAEIATMEGVSGAWTAAAYAGLGLPTPADNPFVADAMFEATPGYAFGDDAAGEEEHGTPKYLGNHGQRPIYADNHALFVAAGPT